MSIEYYSNTLDISDLRERLNELAAQFPRGEPGDDADDETWDAWQELVELREVESNLSWCWNWASHTLININFWQDYCEQTCYDLDDIKRGGIAAQFVDWEKVADAMVQDYRPVQLPEGNDFYVRG